MPAHADLGFFLYFYSPGTVRSMLSIGSRNRIIDVAAQRVNVEVALRLACYYDFLNSHLFREAKYKKKMECAHFLVDWVLPVFAIIFTLAYWIVGLSNLVT